MKRIAMITMGVMTAMASMAQETYENALMVQKDLNGTARYVGMGGAMEALGADLSVIGTNPAGMGLFRSSQAAVSFGGVSQQDAEEFSDAKKTRLSLDQVGFVYSRRTGDKSFVNFGFNYHKSRNFSQILNAAGALNGASQNKQSYMKGASGVMNPEVDKDGNINSKDYSMTQLDFMYYNTLLAIPDEEGYPVYGYYDATGYTYDSYSKGHINEFDFNISGNINDRVYLGFTVGVHSVSYTGYSEYAEDLIDIDNKPIGWLGVADERRITGTGFNVKAGIIIRPMEYSPFRIGLSVASPTWYDLTSENYTNMYNETSGGNQDGWSISNAYDFKLFTPWKFGLSAGTTVDNYLALGASFEYSDYSSLDSRVNEGSEYDWITDSYYEASSSDREMKRHTEKTLKGVSTLKLGAELKPADEIAIRFGYNYVSPMYNSNGQRAYSTEAYGQYYASNATFTNWKETHRFTCGVGFTFDDFTVDAAYQYSAQNGDFHPFNNISDSKIGESNIADAAKMSDKRHQILMTLGYRF